MRALALALVITTGCTTPDPVRVGSKPFAENRVLAELIARVAEDEGLRVERHLDHGDTFVCQDAVRSGVLDVVPEYTGTALTALGLGPRRDADEGWAELRARTGDLGLTWPVRLGFSNPYVVVTTPSVAARHGLRSLSDLVPVLPGDEAVPSVRWTVAAAPEFLARPVDGFEALGRFYGLAGWEATVVSNEPSDRFGALLASDVLLVVADATTPWIDEYGLVVLDDDLSFFPAYEAAPMVRTDALRKHVGLQAALESLDGALSVERIRAANRAVEVDGLEPRQVAETLLAELGRLQSTIPVDVPRARVVVAPGGEAPRLVGLALEAMRQTAPGFQVVAQPSDSPERVLARGEVWAGVVAAPMLFERGSGARAVPRDDVEALAALGEVAVHLIGTSERPVSALTRIGVGPAGGGAARVGSILGQAFGWGASQVSGDREAQWRALDAGELDAVLLLDEVGAATPTLALRIDGRRLVPIEGWADSDLGFADPSLRARRIPPGTYPGLTVPLQTLGTQLVLAAPRRAAPELGGGGPAAALDTTRGLTDAQRGRLGELLAAPLDPSLPRRSAQQPITAALPLQPAVTVVNLMVFGFLGFLLWVFARGTSRLEP